MSPAGRVVVERGTNLDLKPEKERRLVMGRRE